MGIEKKPFSEAFEENKIEFNKRFDELITSKAFIELSNLISKHLSSTVDRENDRCILNFSFYPTSENREKYKDDFIPVCKSGVLSPQNATNNEKYDGQISFEYDPSSW